MNVTAREAAACFERYLQATCDADATVHELEAALIPLVRESGRRALEATTQRRVDECVAQAEASGLRPHRRSEVPFTGVFGKFTVVSPYLLGKGVDGRRSARPAERVGIRGRGRTQGVDRALADFGVEESFGAAAKRFVEHYGFEVERTTILRVVESLGEDAECFVQQRLDEGAACFEQPLAQRPGVDEVLVEMDGCEIRTGRLEPVDGDERTPVRNLPKRRRVTEWRDVRMGLVRPLNEVEPTYVGRLDSLDQVAQDLFGAACRRGLSFRTQVVACADGGNGVHPAIDAHFTNVQHILDRPHLVSHLYESAAAMGLTDAAKQQWVDDFAARLDTGDAEQALADLGAYRGPGSDRIKRLYKYIDRFHDAVHYHTYQARGWPTGSGEVESSHRTVPQRRLKLPGAWWTTRNVQRMLALRVLRANGWWDEFWQQRAKAA